jgi:integrase
VSVHPRPDGKPGYYVRYRDPSGRQREAWGPGRGEIFRRKIDAENFEAALKTDMRRGQWSDPSAKRTTVEELGKQWILTKRDPNTRAWNALQLRHVNERWASTPLSSLDYLTIQAWVVERELAGVGPDSIRGAFRVLHEIVKVAIRMRMIQLDPCDGVKLPRVNRREMVFIAPTQVDHLATVIEDTWRGEGYGALVRFAAYSGCRAGEIGGLQVKHLDLLHRRVRIERTLKTYGGFGPTKTSKVRWVDLPRQLCDVMTAHLERRGAPDSDALVWVGERNGPLNHKWWYTSRFKPVVLELETIPNELRFHDLRHTCVAFLIGQGAQQYEVMEHLGHTKIQTTIDTYGHLFPNVRERIRVALEQTWDEVG